VEIVFGLISLMVWLGIALYVLILVGGIVAYVLYVIFGICFVVLEKLFKSFHLPQTDFLKYEQKIKINEIKSIKSMIKRAKNTKIYLYSGIVMIVISVIFELLFLLGIMYKEYLYNFFIFGIVCLFFGVYYLKIHRRFYEKGL